MINGEGIITATVVSAASIAAAAGHLMHDTRLILAILGSESSTCLLTSMPARWVTQLSTEHTPERA